jgi:hypothetical protein
MGYKKDSAPEGRIVGTRDRSNEFVWRSVALHTESRRFLGKAYRNFSIHTITNLQKYRNSEERDNSTVEGGYLHTVQPEPTSERGR